MFNAPIHEHLKVIYFFPCRYQSQSIHCYFVGVRSAVNDGGVPSAWPWNAFSMPSWLYLCSQALFFSSGREGYLYEALGVPKLIVKYSYTSDCYAAVHTTSAVCALVDSRIEVYTSRVYANAAASCRDLFRSHALHDLSCSRAVDDVVSSQDQGNISYTGI